MIYTIVLTPPADTAKTYIEASQALFKDHNPHYLLKADGTSSPHITVVQFACERLTADAIWAEMCAKIKAEKLVPFSPPLSGVAFVDGEGPYKGTTWAEISCKRGAEESPIMKVHYAALEVLEKFGLKPLNASGNNYRPHLTLARLVMPDQIKTWPKTLCENPGEFDLQLGEPDSEWQFAKSLELFKVREYA